MSEAGVPPPGGSYLARAFSRTENRIATGVTLGLAVAVLAFSRLPLAAGVSVDLREESGWAPAAHATLLGFSEPGAEGRSPIGTAAGAPARVIFNRPLPRAFVLEVEARARPTPARLVIGIGGRRYAADVEGDGPSRIPVDNPGRARELAVGGLAAPGGELLLQRLTVRAP